MTEWEKILGGISPAMDIADTNGGATTGDWISIKGFEGVIILVDMGDGTAGSDLTFTLAQATVVAGTDTKVLNCLQTGRIFRKSAADFATLIASASASAWEKITQATADEKYEPTDSGEEVGLVALVVLASDLDRDGGFDCINCTLNAPGAAKYASMIYIPFGPAYTDSPDLVTAPIED